MCLSEDRCVRGGGLCGLTFDLSGLPKAGPLEGRVRPRSWEGSLAMCLDGEAYQRRKRKLPD